METLISIKEAAIRLGVSRATLYRLLKVRTPDGIRPVHVGRRCLITEAELRRFITRLTARECGEKWLDS